MNWMRIGAVMAALAVTTGALGAHALTAQLASSGHTEHWKTAVQYQFAVIPALFLLAFVRAPRICGPALLSGCLFFSGSLYALCLGGPKWLGAVTPVGGVLLILGHLSLVFAKRLASEPSAKERGEVPN